MEQIVFAVKYLHRKRIIHRDIKPSNIFLDKDSFIKIGDFGLSSILGEAESTKTSSGSPCYAAPEIYLGKQTKLEPDIWGLGVTMFEIITLERAFDGPNVFNIIESIIKGQFNLILLEERSPKPLIPIVKSMLSLEKENRPDINHINCIYIYIYIAHISKLLEETTEINLRKDEELRKKLKLPLSQIEEETEFVEEINYYIIKEEKKEEKFQIKELSRMKCISRNNYLYSFDSKRLNILIIYDIILNTTQKIKLPFKIGVLHASVQLLNEIFVCGGEKSWRITYVIDLENREINMRGNLNVGRSNHKLVSLITTSKHTKYIAIGGLGYNAQLLNSCEKYSQFSNKWTAIAPLNTPKYKVSACNFRNSYIYIFGGEISGGINTQDIELLDLQHLRDGWKLININNNPLKVMNSAFSIQIETNEILIFGGKARNELDQGKYVILDEIYIFGVEGLKGSILKLNERVPKGICELWNTGEPVIREGKVNIRIGCSIYRFNIDRNINDSWSSLNILDWKWLDNYEIDLR